MSARRAFTVDQVAQIRNALARAAVTARTYAGEERLAPPRTLQPLPF